MMIPSSPIFKISFIVFVTFGLIGCGDGGLLSPGKKDSNAGAAAPGDEPDPSDVPGGSNPDDTPDSDNPGTDQPTSDTPTQSDPGSDGEPTVDDKGGSDDTTTTNSPVQTPGKGGTETPGQNPTQSKPDPELEITGISFDGNGCPADTVGLAVASELNNIVLTYENMKAIVGGKTFDNAAECKVTMTIKFNDGYQFAVSEFATKGLVDLEANTTASLAAALSTDAGGVSVALNDSKDYAGAVTENFSIDMSVEEANQAWSDCGGEATIVIDHTVSAESLEFPAAGFISMNAADGDLYSNVGINFRDCQ